MNIFFKKGGLGGQKGFASLLLILAVAVVGVVAGYVAFDKQKNITPAIPSYDGLVSTSTLPVANKSLGANGTEIPTSIALFETSLSSKITNVATSMTLVSATDKAGTTLASSTYAFIIDEGKANEEMVLADCTGTACANMIRGLSPLTGTTTVSSLKFAHNRGASVKITDGPQLLILSRMANGQNDYPNLIRYKSGVTVTSGDSDQTLASKGYVLNTANAGAATSTESRGGLVELGTLAEQASSYDGGSDKPTVLQTKNSTSTCQVVGSYNIVASTTTGRLDKGCFDQTANYTFTGTNTFSATTTMATSTMASTTITNLNVTNLNNVDISSGLAKTVNIQTFTTAGADTWTKPANALKVLVQLWGAGGSGGNSPTGGSVYAGGGGGGNYVERWLNAADLTSTVAVTVGTGGPAQATTATNGTAGTATTFGAYESASGGAAGTQGTDGSNGGAGGSIVGSVTSFWAAGGSGSATPSTGIYSGGGGSAGAGGDFAGGAAVYGGAGGGSADNNSGQAGGTSTYGGNGGAAAFGTNATAGAQPGGGGGAVGHTSGTFSSGKGGDGKAIITTFF